MHSIFDFDPQVARLGVTGTYFILRDVRVPEANAEFAAFRATTLARVLRQLPDDPKRDPAISDLLQLRDTLPQRRSLPIPSSLYLVDYARRRGNIPAVNVLVDIYNLVSLEYRLAIGAHDIANVHTPIRLTITKGTERFVPIGADESKPVVTGVYAYVDAANDVICYLEARQVAKSRIQMTTRDCFYIVQGGANLPADIYARAVSDLLRFTTMWCGGRPELLYSSHGWSALPSE